MSIDEKKLAAILWKLAAMMYECERMTTDNANLVVSGHSPAYDTDAFGAIFTLCAKELAPSISELLNDRPASIETLPTHGGEAWQPVPETLPPDPEGGWYSPIVWLALSDGRVLPGQALHNTSWVKPPVRDWFVIVRDHVQEPGRVRVINYLGAGVTVVAWKPIATPDHPRSNE